MNLNKTKSSIILKEKNSEFDNYPRLKSKDDKSSSIKIVQNPLNQKEHFLAFEINYTSRKEAKICLKRLKNRISINHPNLLEIKDYSLT